MGAEAKCRAKFDGRTCEGKALLETSSLLFRGDFRLQIPFTDIRHLQANDRTLSVDWTGGSATFELGKLSAKWLQKIQNPPTLLDKLGVKAGSKVGLIGMDAFVAELEAAGAEVVATLSGSRDLVLLAAENLKDLLPVKEAVDLLGDKGALWIVYPKGRKEIRESDVRQAGKSAGLVDIKVASFSATHTALKFTRRRPTA